METHTLKFDSRRPAPAGQHFPPTGQKSWWGDCHRTSINHIGLSSIYYNSGGRKMDTVKNKNSSLTLDDGMPRVCGRPAGRNFSCFPYSSARQLDSYGEWGKMYLTFFVCNRPRWGDGAGGEGEVFFSIVYCVDKVEQRESCVILNYKLQLYSRWLVCFSCCDGARSRILFLFTFRPNSHWRIVDISIFRPSTQFPFSYIHPSAGRRTGHIVVYKRSVPAIAMEIKIYL